MTDLRDPTPPTDDLIRDAVHELVSTAPAPRTLGELAPAAVHARRWLTAAAAVLLVGGVVTAAVLLRGDDDPGAVVSAPGPTTSADGWTIGSTVSELPVPDGVGSIDRVDAQVIGRSPAESEQRVEIDRGSAAGVRVGMPVVDAAGLVGKVVDVFPGTSVVMLVTDPAHHARVTAVPTGRTAVVPRDGVISGAGAERPLLLALAGDGAGVAVGDPVVTVGGSDDLAPPDIPVGRVGRVIPSGDLEVEPSADIDRLDRVTVLLYRPPNGSIDPDAGIVGDVPDDGSSETTEPDGTGPGAGDAAVPNPLGSGWRAEALTGADGRPWVTTDAPRRLVELGGRRLVLGESPSGCCFTSLDAWLDDGGGTWQRIELGDRFGMGPDTTAIIGAGPADVVSDGSTAVAVGALVEDVDGEFVSHPAAWVTGDLVEWEQVELPGTGRLDEVVRVPSGWIALGTVDETQQVYASTDGRTWQPSLGAGGRDVETGPRLVAAGVRAFVDFGDGSRAWSDGGSGWTEVAGPVDDRLLQAGDRIVALGPDGARWTRNGVDWTPLAAPPAAMTDALDPWFPPPAAFGIVDGGERALVLLDRTIWVGGTDAWTPVPLGEAEFPTTRWGPSFLTGLSVGADGTLVVLGVVPQEPGNKPVGTAIAWTHEPVGPPPPTTVIALPFGTRGTAEEMCTDAAEAIVGADDAEGLLLADRSSSVDDTDVRWLVCTDERAQYGVAVIVERDGLHHLALLGLGTLFHAGDGAELSVDGAVATVTYRSLVNESANGSTATTTDGGGTWSVTRYPPTVAEWARDLVLDALEMSGFRSIGGDHDVTGSATFGAQDESGATVTGLFLLGRTEPVGERSPTGTASVAGREVVLLDDRSLFVACGGVGITIAGDTGDLTEAVVAIALDRLGC